MLEVVQLKYHVGGEVKHRSRVVVPCFSLLLFREVGNGTRRSRPY